MEYIWLAVTPDEYELPIAVEKSAYLLAKLLGVTKNTVQLASHAYARGKDSGLRRGYRVTRVLVPKEYE